MNDLTHPQIHDTRTLQQNKLPLLSFNSHSPSVSNCFSVAPFLAEQYQSEMPGSFSPNAMVFSQCAFPLNSLN